MKINNPVTNNEVLMQPGKPIVSKTDLKGCITYANQNFIDISGFGREELLGKNHNIVRHPDMPPEAFAWLWDTIKQGLPWHGVVKNRCKNGDYYWVDAYVTPLKENGTVAGYMSVHNIPKREDVTRSETLYQAIGQGESSLASQSRRNWTDIPLMRKLDVIFAVLLLLLGGSAVMGAYAAETRLDYALTATAVLAAALVVISKLALSVSVGKFAEQANYALDQVAEGNFQFNIKVNGKDEFGRILMNLESMRINLRAIVSDVILASRNVDSGAKNVASEMNKLLGSSDNQFDRVNGISAAVEEMHHSIESASQRTRSSEEMAQTTSDIVRRGSQQILDSIQSVERILAVVNKSRSTVMNLNESVQKIEDLTKTIKDVAGQTNLLALNAAIEAARAGEQGRGFAVVADEVRKLAERTSHSTLDINEMVTSIQNATSETVSTMDNAVGEVGRGTQLINESNRSLSEILDANNRELEMAHEISSMLQQLDAVADEVARHMSEVQTATSGNAEDIRTTEHESKLLVHSATELNRLVRHFEKSL